MANSFYNNDPEDSGAYRKMVMLCIAAASVVMLLFLVVLYVNSNNKKTDTADTAAVESEESDEETEEESKIGKSNLTSSDLDFWDMYDEEADDEQLPEEEEPAGVSAEFTPEKKTDEEDENKEEKDSMTKTPEEEPAADDEMNDGKHIAIADEDGNKVWYEILEDVPKNTYKLDEYLKQDGEKLTYTESGKSSAFGIDVSKYQGNIDWKLVKEADVKFAMLRVASRGYESGQLFLDDNFVTYAKGAKENGIDIGVYVYSQAVNEIEAVEEANFAVAAVSNYAISYPIACDIEDVENDTARTDGLTTEERTKCVKAFCDTVRTYGYEPVIYAKRDFLITGLDMEMLSDYDVWLADSSKTAGSDREEDEADLAASDKELPGNMQSEQQQEDTDAGITTDYPYQFTMWQYAESGTINGISGSVNLDICFVNYDEK